MKIYSFILPWPCERLFFRKDGDLLFAVFQHIQGQKKKYARFFLISALVFLCVECFFCKSAFAEGIKCWINHEKIRECGSFVPPEYTQQGYQEIDEKGFLKRSVDRAMTLEEYKEQQQREREQAEQKREDDVLLNTFSHADEITLMRDKRLLAIDSNIKVILKRNENIAREIARYNRLIEQRKSLQQKADIFAADLIELQKRIEDNKAYIAKQEQEKKNVMRQYGEHLARFIELKKK